VTIQTNRTLGGIGASLTVIGAVSSVSSLFRYAYPNSGMTNLAYSAISSIVGSLTFIGFILFFIAMYGFSKDYNEHKIFNYILYGIIVTIIAAVIVGVIAFIIIFANLGNIIPNFNSSTNSPTQISDMMLNYLSPVVAIIGFVGLIYVIFNVKAFNLLADKSQVPLFRTAAKVLLAGSLLNIVVGVVFAALAYSGSASLNAFTVVAIPGGFVQDIAWLLLAIAFFRIKPPKTQSAAVTNIPLVSRQLKYCSNCGASNQIDSTYCARCGQKL
jgi:uncharacterized membrane protein